MDVFQSDQQHSGHPTSPSGTDIVFYPYGDFTTATSPSGYTSSGLNMSPQTRSRLATWTYSPDSGYSESALSGGQKTLSARANARGAKRRANSLEGSSGMPENELNRQDSAVGSDIDVEFETPAGKCEYEGETFVYPSRTGNIELVVLRQPEARHRPRYQTEGSRGRIKDRSGSSSPAVQLKNFRGRSAILQIYVGVETGVPRPHPLFKICKVNNKVAAPAMVREMWNNIAVLEMAFSEKRDWTIDVDCVSLMKLRNVDCENSGIVLDPAKRVRSRRGTGGSPKIRLVFRAILTMPNGSKEILQAASTPISCCSSLGLPEINFVSHKSCRATGGTEVVVLGRSFVKNDSKLLVVEKSMEDELIWESEATQLVDKFNQVHIVARLPPYRDIRITDSVPVYLCVRNSDGKQSDLYPFAYTPDGALQGLEEEEEEKVEQKRPVPSTSHSAQRRISLVGQVQAQDSPVLPSSPQTVYTFPSLPTSPTVPTPAYASSSGTHYCVELPGMVQPIIITIPGPSIPSTSTEITGPIHATIDLSNSMQSHQSMISPTQTQFRPLIHTPMAMPDASPAPVDNYDSSKAFDDLLREILGPDSGTDTFPDTVSQPSPAQNEPAWMLETESTAFNADDYQAIMDQYNREFPPS